MQAGDCPVVKWKCLSPEATCPTRGYAGDAGWDLYVANPTLIPGNSFVEVDTGIAIEMPGGIWARIVARSSASKKLGLVVLEGIIDNGYRGELFARVYNPQSNPVHLERGDRIAQLIPQLLVPIAWKQVSELNISDRGDRGFGSTGK